MRRRDKQRVLGRRRSEAVSPRPRRGATERLVEQCGIRVEQNPLLAASDDRRQETEQAAGASARRCASSTLRAA
jgi:hypothetical protein